MKALTISCKFNYLVLKPLLIRKKQSLQALTRSVLVKAFFPKNVLKMKKEQDILKGSIFVNVKEGYKVIGCVIFKNYYWNGYLYLLLSQ